MLLVQQVRVFKSYISRKVRVELSRRAGSFGDSDLRFKSQFENVSLSRQLIFDLKVVLAGESVKVVNLCSVSRNCLVVFFIGFSFKSVTSSDSGFVSPD